MVKRNTKNVGHREKRSRVNIILFGPVSSRRLGKSLGINLIPPKTCSLDCIYCQLGSTPKTSVKRYSYLSANEVETNLKRFLAKGGRADYLTLSGGGEPTLNAQIGKIIRRIKTISRLPVAVLTNATLFTSPKVRRELLAADLVLPSLDAARQATFKKINRPHRRLKIKNIIQGLQLFRRQFKGKLWLEIMLVRNINDSKKELEALNKAVLAIKPDKIQLNTVVREPAEKFAHPLTVSQLQKTKKFFGDRCEIISGRKDKRKRMLKALKPNYHTS